MATAVAGWPPPTLLPVAEFGLFAARKQVQSRLPFSSAHSTLLFLPCVAESLFLQFVRDSLGMPGLGNVELGQAVAMSQLEGTKKTKKVKSVEVAAGGSSPVVASPVALEPEKKKKSKEKKKEQAAAGSKDGVSEQLPKASSQQQQKKKRAKHGEEDVAVEEVLPSAKKLKTGKVLENGLVKENGLPAAVAEAFNPMAVSNFGISDVLREKLKSKGIESLFPIQAQTFDAVFSGNDLVGRARTGQVCMHALVFLLKPSNECYLSVFLMLQSC